MLYYTKNHLTLPNIVFSIIEIHIIMLKKYMSVKILYIVSNNDQFTYPFSILIVFYCFNKRFI